MEEQGTHKPLVVSSNLTLATFFNISAGFMPVVFLIRLQCVISLWDHRKTGSCNPDRGIGSGMLFPDMLVSQKTVRWSTIRNGLNKQTVHRT